MEGGSRQRIESILRAALETGRRQLFESEVYQILAEVGVPTPRFAVVPIDADDGARRKAAERIVSAPRPDGIVIKISLQRSSTRRRREDRFRLHQSGGDLARGRRGRRSGPPQTPPPPPSRACFSARGSPMRRTSRATRSFSRSAGPGPRTDRRGRNRRDPDEWYGKLAPNQTTWVVSARDPIFQRETPPEMGSLGPAFSLLFAPSRLHNPRRSIPRPSGRSS